MPLHQCFPYRLDCMTVPTVELRFTFRFSSTLMFELTPLIFDQRAQVLLRAAVQRKSAHISSGNRSSQHCKCACASYKSILQLGPNLETSLSHRTSRLKLQRSDSVQGRRRSAVYLALRPSLPGATEQDSQSPKDDSYNLLEAVEGCREWLGLTEEPLPAAASSEPARSC
jgi:hypothetical protein